MAHPHLDIEEIADILVDASLMGDRQAAAKWDISERTVRLHRQRMGQMPELGEAYQLKKSTADVQWSDDRVRFLRLAIGKLSELVALASVEQIRDVAGALKIVGDLEVVCRAIDHDQQPRPPGAGQTAARPASLDKAIARLETH